MAIELVQQAAGGSSYINSGTITLNGVTAGDVLTLAIAAYTGAAAYSPHSVTDNTGNTWVLATSETTYVNVALYYVAKAVGGNTTVTVTFENDNSVLWNLAEWSGLAASGGYDVQTYNYGTASPGTTGAINTTQANDLVIGLFSVKNATPGTISNIGSAGGTPTALSWDAGASSVAHGGAAYQIVSATGNFDYSATTSGDWGGVIVAFKGPSTAAIPLSGGFAQSCALAAVQSAVSLGAWVESAMLSSSGTSQMAGQGGLETQAYAQAISAMLAQISQSLSANASIKQVFALAGALLAGFEVATGVGTESTALTNVLTSLTQQVETSEAGTVNLGLSATATAELVFALAGALAASFGTAAEVSANSTALANVLVSLTQQIETSGIATVNLYATSEEAIQTLLSSTLAMQTTIPGTAQSELNSTLTAQTTIPSTAQSELNSVLTAQTAASALGLAQAIAQLAVASSMNAVEVIAQSVLATLTLNTTIDMEFGLSLVALLEESGAISAVAAKVIRIALVLAASLTHAVVITAPLAQALVLSASLSQTVIITAPLAQKLVLSSRLSPTLVIAGGL